MSCVSSYGGANRSSTVREVGSVHVAVLSVAPWSRYVEKLQPNFQLTEEGALAQVLGDTRIGRSEEISALGVSAQQTKGDGSADSGGAGASISSLSDRVPPWLDTIQQTPSEKPDPFLQYAAAAALYQEVQLLNRTLRDAAIPDGHVGYVVRMQITLLPRRRHAPYDAYTTIGFFLPAATGVAAGGLEPRVSGAAPATPNRGSDDLLLATGQMRGPRVLPLLVTDSLEATLRERGSQEAFAISLSLASFRPELSQLFGLDQIQQASQDFLRGRDLNATMTVGRLSENTLQVRLGAMQEVTTNFAMVPRTYNITALVTVPEGRTDSLEIVARTRIVDAKTGVELPGTTAKKFAKLVDGVMGDYGLGREEGLGRNLLRHAQANDNIGFDAELEGVVGRRSAAWQQRGSLWIDLVGLGAGNQYASDRIDLPDPGSVGSTSEFFFEQTPLLSDDGTSAYVRIMGLTLDEGVAAEALLVIDGDVQVRIPAVEVQSEPGSPYVDLIFPSFRSAGLILEGSMARMSLRLRWGDQEETFDVVAGK